MSAYRIRLEKIGGLSLVDASEMAERNPDWNVHEIKPGSQVACDDSRNG